MNIGQALRKIRKGKRIKIVDLAEITGVSEMTIYALEYNRSNTRIITLQALADGLGVKMSDIILEAEKYA